MDNTAHFITDVQIGSSHSQNQNQTKSNVYPVEAFPSVLRNIITTLHEDTQIPIELIGCTTLAASALALQPIVEIIPPYSHEPEPCSLYILNMARSGEGKSTLNRIIMKPFYEFSTKMKIEYSNQLAIYKKEQRLWNVTRRALESDYCKSVKRNDSEVEKLILQDHLDSEPSKPNAFNIIYEDATPKSIIEGLNEYPYGGIISDEAVTFFTGYTKNNLGLHNKTWSGDTYTLQRAREEDININAYLTLSLMVQPGIFSQYLKKHFGVASSSGFLSRFLFSTSKSTIGSRQSNLNNNSDSYVSEFHKTLNHILNMQKTVFNTKRTEKKRLVFSGEARSFFQNKYAEYQKFISDGQRWGYMQSIGAKAGTNAIRIAGIIHEMENISNNKSTEEISSVTLRNAFSIMDWHMGQAEELFYPMSPQYSFVQDVYELFNWIRNHFKYPKKYGNLEQILDGLVDKPPFEPFPKRDIETHGPNRLRRINKLDPVLSELAALGVITVVQSLDNGSLYIVAMQPAPHNLPVSGGSYPKRQQTILSTLNVKPRFNNYDHRRFLWC